MENSKNSYQPWLKRYKYCKGIYLEKKINLLLGILMLVKTQKYSIGYGESYEGLKFKRLDKAKKAILKPSKILPHLILIQFVIHMFFITKIIYICSIMATILARLDLELLFGNNND